MNVLILSEYNLIKTTIKQAFRQFGCINNIMTIYPNNVKSVLNENINSRLSIGKPDIIVVDIDTKNCLCNYFEIAYELIANKIYSGKVRPEVVLLATKQQYESFKLYFEYDDRHELNFDDIEYIKKPYTMLDLYELIQKSTMLVIKKNNSNRY